MYLRSSRIPNVKEWHVEDIRIAFGKLPRDVIDKFRNAGIICHRLSQLLDNRYCVFIHNIHFMPVIYSVIQKLLFN